MIGYDRLWLWGGIMCQIVGPPVAFERADRSSTQRSLLTPPSRAEAQWSRHSCIYIYIWVNYNDLTATSLESWLIRGIIPNGPTFQVCDYYNLPIYIYIYMYIYGIFIEYSNNSTNTPMLGIKIEVGKWIQLINCTERYWVCWRNARDDIRGPNKHQQTSTNYNSHSKPRPLLWLSPAALVPGCLDSHRCQLTLCLVAHFQSKESAGEFQDVPSTLRHRASHSRCFQCCGSSKRLGHFEVDLVAFEHKEAPFFSERQERQGHHWVIHMSRSRWGRHWSWQNLWV